MYSLRLIFHSLIKVHHINLKVNHYFIKEEYSRSGVDLRILKVYHTILVIQSYHHFDYQVDLVKVIDLK